MPALRSLGPVPALFTLAASLVLAGCHTPPPPPPVQQVRESRDIHNERIRIGDLIEIRFSDTPDASRIPLLQPRVNGDGEIALPFDVVLKAAGKTTNALAADIRAAYVPKHFVNLTAHVVNKSVRPPTDPK